MLQRRRLPVEERPEVPFAEAISGPEHSRGVLVMDRLGFWTLVGFVLILAVYMPTLIRLLSQMILAPGYRLW